MTKEKTENESKKYFTELYKKFFKKAVEEQKGDITLGKKIPEKDKKWMREMITKEKEKITRKKNGDERS